MHGKIVRDTQRGELVVAAAGTRYRFDLQAHWRGQCAPRVDQVVEVTFSPGGLLLSVQPVDVATLTSKQGWKGLAQGKTALGSACTRGKAAARYAVARIGVADITGVVALALGTTVFTALSVRIMGTRVSDLNMYSMLGLISGVTVIPGTYPGFGGTTSRGAGVFALLWLASILGPLIPSLSRHRFAPLGYFLPFGLLLAVGMGTGLAAYRLMESIGQIRGYYVGSRVTTGRPGDLMNDLWQGISIGTGAYLTVAVALFFCYRGWLALRARQSAHSRFPQAIQRSFDE